MVNEQDLQPPLARLARAEQAGSAGADDDGVKKWDRRHGVWMRLGKGLIVPTLTAPLPATRGARAAHASDQPRKGRQHTQAQAQPLVSSP